MATINSASHFLKSGKEEYFHIEEISDLMDWCKRAKEKKIKVSKHIKDKWNNSNIESIDSEGKKLKPVFKNITGDTNNYEMTFSEVLDTK